MDPNLHSEYEFIIGENGGKDLSPQPAMTQGSSKKKKWLLIGGLGVVIIIFITVGGAVMSSGGDKTTTSLLAVAQQQTELIRVAQLGVKKARIAQVKGFAITTQTTVKSDNSSLLAYLKTNNLPADSKSIGKSATADKTDQTLTAAEQSNQFDDVFTQVLQAEILSYQSKLKQAYSASGNTNTKELLQKFYQNTALLSGSKAQDSSSSQPQTDASTTPQE